MGRTISDINNRKTEHYLNNSLVGGLQQCQKDFENTCKTDNIN